MRNVKVRRAINEGQRLRSQRLGITADRIAVELANIAFADLRDIVSIEGGQMRVRDTAELTRQQSAAISEISETNAGCLRVRMHSKVAALENLGKQLGLIDQQVPVTTTTEIVIRTKEESLAELDRIGIRVVNDISVQDDK